MNASSEETEACSRVRERLGVSLGTNAMNTAVPVAVAGGLATTAIASKTAAAIKANGIVALAPAAKLALVSLAITGTAHLAYRWAQPPSSNAGRAPAAAIDRTSASDATRAAPTFAASPPASEVATAAPIQAPAAVPQLAATPARSQRVLRAASASNESTPSAAQPAAIPNEIPAMVRADVAAVSDAATAARTGAWTDVREYTHRYFSLTTRDHALDPTASYLETLARCRLGEHEAYAAFRSAHPTSPWLPALSEACAAAVSTTP